MWSVVGKFFDQLSQDHPIVFAILSGLVGSVLAFPVYNLLARIRLRPGDYDGSWKTEIFDDQNNVVKRDEMVLRQTGNDLRGLIYRQIPEDQSHRQWEFVGHVRGEAMLGMFWALQDTVPSYGAWHVTQIHDFCFEGYYLRNDAGQLRQIKLRITKQK